MRTNKNLVLAAMVFAVAMTFIDQTIVAIAIPKIQSELSPSATGTQWVINGYLLALSALFAFGGKLGDVLGRKRMVLILGLWLGAIAGTVHDVQLAFAHSMQTVFYIMAGVMVATFIVAVRWLPRGRLESAEEQEKLAMPATAEQGTMFR